MINRILQKRLITLLMLVMAVSSCVAGNFKVTLKPASGASTAYSLTMAIYKDGKTDALRETLQLTDGCVTYSTDIESPCRGMLRGTNGGSSFSFIAMPGQEAVITVEPNGRTYHFSGTSFYEQYNNADRFDEELYEGYEKKMENASDEVKAELMKEYAGKLEDYVRSHSKEPGAICIASQIGMERYAELADAEVRNGILSTLIDLTIKADAQRREQERKEEELIRSMEGKPAPEITLQDINGKPLSLSSLKGKYVILDFWGSWCIWCIRGIPKMKEYYAKYSDKMEILGIDCRDRMEKWKDAVAKHQLPWLHVYNPDDSTVLKDYNVMGFPTKVVVGPDGTLIKVIIGEDPAFYTYLDNLLGK